MVATIWQRLQEDPIHVLVLCGSAAASALLFALALRIFLTYRLPEKQEEERELANQE